MCIDHTQAECKRGAVLIMVTVIGSKKPEFLYRYRSVFESDDTRFNQEMENLDNNCVWCSPIAALNDPMEGYYMADAKLGIPDELDPLITQIFYQKISRKICAFSETHDNELMWSHYADHFKGMCIRYDVEKMIDNLSDQVVLAKVDYRKKLFSISTKDVDKAILGILTRKTLSWKYEKEWRFIKNGDSKLQLLNKSAISRIYLGSRFSKNREKQLLDFCTANGIPCYRTIVNGYSLEFAKV